MNDVTQLGLSALFIGTAATAVMDLGGLALNGIAGIPPPNYSLVGRWFGYMGKGRFRHNPVSASVPIRGEGLIGWLVHYAVGIAFAAVLLVAWGLDWVSQPTIGPALIVGVGSLAAPFFVMQPAMGAGIASRKAPNPAAARRRSLINHLLFGIGLYVAGRIAELIAG